MPTGFLFIILQLITIVEVAVWGYLAYFAAQTLRQVKNNEENLPKLVAVKKITLKAAPPAYKKAVQKSLPNSTNKGAKEF